MSRCRFYRHAPLPAPLQTTPVVTGLTPRPLTQRKTVVAANSAQALVYEEGYRKAMECVVEAHVVLCLGAQQWFRYVLARDSETLTQASHC